MANQAIRKPRFYVDLINYQMARGVAQNGNFDVTATATNYKGLQTGTEAELFDMRPLNLCTFDTSAASNGTAGDGHVLITINKGNTTSKVNYIAILNHNLATATGKIRIFAGNIASDVASFDGSAAETADINWSSVAITKVVNADNLATGSDNKSTVIRPATDGTTIFTFPEQTLQYWGIQFEGSDGGADADTDETWHSSSDFSVGCIMMGEYIDLRSPDLNVVKTITFDQVTQQTSIGGQKFSNMTSYGRSVSSTSKSPFSISQNPQNIYGGRISYDMRFSYLAASELTPSEYVSVGTDDSVIEDIFNRTHGSHIPMIFSCDSTSVEDNAESEHIFARLDQNSLEMTQVALDTYNIQLRIVEEF